MINDIKGRVAIFVMVFLLMEYLDGGEKKVHPIENQFSHDISSRTYLTSVASITASATADLTSIKIIQDFIQKL